MWFGLLMAAAHAACGDTSLDPGEGCDDGNAAAGDGCSATCEPEPGMACTQPSTPFSASVTTNAQIHCGNPFAPLTVAAPAWGAYAITLGAQCASPFNTTDRWAPWINARATSATAGPSAYDLLMRNGEAYYPSATCPSVANGVSGLIDASGGGGIGLGHADDYCGDNRGGSAVTVTAVSWCAPNPDLDGDGVPNGSDLCPTVADHVPSYHTANRACVSPTATVDGAVIGAAATVHAGANVSGALIGAKASVGRNSTLGAGSSLGRRAVIGDEVPLGTGVVIGRAASIGRDAVAADGAAIDGLVLGYGATVGRGVTLGDGVIVSNLAAVEDGAALGGGVRLGRGARVAADAVVEDGVRLGPDSAVEAGARVGADSTLARGASVGAGAIVGSLVRVGREATVEGGAYVGDRAVLRADARVTSGALLDADTTLARGTVHSAGGRVVALSGGVRRWSDGSVAASCEAYRRPGAGSAYLGDTGNGAYAIQPEGQGTITVACDMGTDGGGWTLFGSWDSGFSYAAARTANAGVPGTADALGAKPEGTVGRMVLRGAGWSFDVRQTGTVGMVPSAGASYSAQLEFGTVAAQSGATLDLSSMPMRLNSTLSGYSGSHIVTVAGGFGSTVGGFTFNRVAGVCVPMTGIFWVPSQGVAGGFNVKNTMDLSQHDTCSNSATGVTVTDAALWYR
jgi:cysteine-rich repeat protein